MARWAVAKEFFLEGSRKGEQDNEWKVLTKKSGALTFQCQMDSWSDRVARPEKVPRYKV